MPADLRVNVKNAKNAKKEEGEAKVGVQVPTFKTFQQVFTRELSSPHFGERKHDIEPGSKSAGAKELEHAGVKGILLKTAFLHRVHRLLRECARLMQEQGKVCGVSANLGRSVRKYRDAQKTLLRLQKQVRTLRAHLERDLAPHVLEHLDTAAKELMFAEDVLFDAETTQSSRIHPDLRRKHDKDTPETKYELRFQSLLPAYDYELDSLNKKAPHQWLVETLDRTLQRCFVRGHKRVTDTTRYRIISAILKSSGLDPIFPPSIKEYFRDRTRRKKAHARNSQVS